MKKAFPMHRLPPELRNAIWYEAVTSTPRLIEVESNQWTGKMPQHSSDTDRNLQGDKWKLRSTGAFEPHDIFLHVNSESRAIAQGIYTPLDKREPRRGYFNPLKDTFFVRWEDEEHRRNLDVPKDALIRAGVRSLTIATNDLRFHPQDCWIPTLRELNVIYIVRKSLAGTDRCADIFYQDLRERCSLPDDPADNVRIRLISLPHVHGDEAFEKSLGQRAIFPESLAYRYEYGMSDDELSDHTLDADFSCSTCRSQTESPQP